MVHHVDVMGNEKIGKLHLFLKALQKLHDLGLYGHIQGRNRLIRHQETGMGDQSLSDTDPLALSAGKLRGLSVKIFVRQPHSVQHIISRRFHILLAHTLGIIQSPCGS